VEKRFAAHEIAVTFGAEFARSKFVDKNDCTLLLQAAKEPFDRSLESSNTAATTLPVAKCNNRALFKLFANVSQPVLTEHKARNGRSMWNPRKMNQVKPSALGAWLLTSCSFETLPVNHLTELWHESALVHRVVENPSKRHRGSKANPSLAREGDGLQADQARGTPNPHQENRVIIAKLEKYAEYVLPRLRRLLQGGRACLDAIFYTVTFQVSIRYL
jgi:hypothetical protein